MGDGYVVPDNDKNILYIDPNNFMFGQFLYDYLTMKLNLKEMFVWKRY